MFVASCGYAADQILWLGRPVEYNGEPGIRDSLLLVEAVTSSGPEDTKQHNELGELLDGATSCFVYMLAFPIRDTVNKHLGGTSWETKVWCANPPTFLIHFSDERFLGRYEGVEQ